MKPLAVDRSISSNAAVNESKTRGKRKCCIFKAPIHRDVLLVLQVDYSATDLQNNNLYFFDIISCLLVLLISCRYIGITKKPVPKLGTLAVIR